MASAVACLVLYFDVFLRSIHTSVRRLCSDFPPFSPLGERNTFTSPPLRVLSVQMLEVSPLIIVGTGLQLEDEMRGQRPNEEGKQLMSATLAPSSPAHDMSISTPPTLES